MPIASRVTSLLMCERSPAAGQHQVCWVNRPQQHPHQHLHRSSRSAPAWQLLKVRGVVCRCLPGAASARAGTTTAATPVSMCWHDVEECTCTECRCTEQAGRPAVVFGMALEFGTATTVLLLITNLSQMQRQAFINRQAVCICSCM